MHPYNLVVTRRVIIGKMIGKSIGKMIGILKGGEKAVFARNQYANLVVAVL